MVTEIHYVLKKNPCIGSTKNVKQFICFSYCRLYKSDKMDQLIFIEHGTITATDSDICLVNFILVRIVLID